MLQGSREQDCATGKKCVRDSNEIIEFQLRQLSPTLNQLQLSLGWHTIVLAANLTDAEAGQADFDR